MNWYFRAKVLKVLSYSKVDLKVDLGFDISCRLKMDLKINQVDKLKEEKAKDCLVAIIGGNRLIIKTPDTSLCQVCAYLMYFVPLQGISEIVLDKKLPSVYKIMMFAEKNDYDSTFLYQKLGKN